MAMDDRQFHQFLDEFREMKNDITLEFGRFGLSSMNRGLEERGQLPKEEKMSDILSPFSTLGDSIDDGTSVLEDKLESMKHHTYSVRITNAMSVFVRPMHERMEELQDENHLFQNRLQHETSIYLSTIITQIRRLEEKQKDTFMSAVRSQYQMFLRSPIITTLAGINRFLVTPMFKATAGILFGFNKKKSVDEQILEAIKQQTEFLRKGEIEPSRGFFGRVVQGGLAGLVGRTLTSSMGMGRGAAQRREDALSRGKPEEAGGIRGMLAHAMFRGDITKRGRNGRGADLAEDEAPYMDPTEKLLGFIHKTIEIGDEKIKNAIEASLEKRNKHTDSTSEETQEVFTEVLEPLKDTNKKLIQYIKIGNEDRAQNVTSMEEYRQRRQEQQESLLGILTNMRGDTKVTAKEAIRTRRARMMQMLGSIFGFVANFGMRIVNAITNLGPAITAALGGTLFISAISKGMHDGWRRIRGKDPIHGSAPKNTPKNAPNTGSGKTPSSATPKWADKVPKWLSKFGGSRGKLAAGVIAGGTSASAAAGSDKGMSAGGIADVVTMKKEAGSLVEYLFGLDPNPKLGEFKSKRQQKLDDSIVPTTQRVEPILPKRDERSVLAKMADSLQEIGKRITGPRTQDGILIPDENQRPLQGEIPQFYPKGEGSGIDLPEQREEREQNREQTELFREMNANLKALVKEQRKKKEKAPEAKTDNMPQLNMTEGVLMRGY